MGSVAEEDDFYRWIADVFGRAWAPKASKQAIDMPEAGQEIGSPIPGDRPETIEIPAE